MALQLKLQTPSLLPLLKDSLVGSHLCTSSLPHSRCSLFLRDGLREQKGLSPTRSVQSRRPQRLAERLTLTRKAELLTPKMISNREWTELGSLPLDRCSPRQRNQQNVKSLHDQSHQKSWKISIKLTLFSSPSLILLWQEPLFALQSIRKTRPGSTQSLMKDSARISQNPLPPQSVKSATSVTMRKREH